MDENNDYYKSEDGNLYTKDGSVLMQYAIGKQETSFVVPDTVTTVDSKAFSRCAALESVVLPDSVTSIEAYAFYECYNLKSVIFGDPSDWTASGTVISEAEISDPATAAEYLQTYYYSYWERC